MSAFTSNLSAAEFVLVREAGFRPITQVMGSSFSYFGYVGARRSRFIPRESSAGVWPGYPNAAYVELKALTEAWNQARNSALARLAEQASDAGADAVVATRFARSRYDWAGGLIEFSMTGTAIALERIDLGDELVLTNLSGQDLALLVQHGYWPRGLVARTSVTCVVSGYKTSRIYAKAIAVRPNEELSELSRAPYEARRNVFALVDEEADRLGASGLVNVKYDQRIEPVQNPWSRHDLIVTLHVMGTAIVESSDAVVLDPTLALQLREPRHSGSGIS